MYLLLCPANKKDWRMEIGCEILVLGERVKEAEKNLVMVVGNM